MENNDTLKAKIAELEEILNQKDRLLEKYRQLIFEMTGENLQDSQEPIQQKSP